MGFDKQEILRHLFNPVLARNRRFIGRHKGETCYIFGNGASLKNMDFNSFMDHPAIGLNFLCIHNDFLCLNMQYYILAEPFYFYSFIKNPYNGKYQKNVMGRLFNKAFSAYPDVILFTSISNILGAPTGRTFYLHHFGNRKPSRDVMDISGEFSFMGGALLAGIGLAINLGFKKAYLVGCDYLLSPMRGGHFYSHGPSIAINNGKGGEGYGSFLEQVDGLIDLCVITDIGESRSLSTVSYFDLKARRPAYKENAEIVAPEYLDILNEAFKLGQFTNNIYPLSR